MFSRWRAVATDSAMYSRAMLRGVANGSRGANARTNDMLPCPSEKGRQKVLSTHAPSADARVTHADTTSFRLLELRKELLPQHLRQPFVTVDGRMLIRKKL